MRSTIGVSRKPQKSQYHGVIHVPHKGWFGVLRVKERQERGPFATEEEAALARDAMLIEAFGPFAEGQNFPPGTKTATP